MIAPPALSNQDMTPSAVVNVRHTRICPRGARSKAFVEVAVLTAVMVLALLLSGPSGSPGQSVGRVIPAVALVLAVYLILRAALGLGRRSWLHAGMRDLAALATCIAVATGCLAVAEALAWLGGLGWTPYSPAALFVATAFAYLSISHLKLASRFRRSLRRPRGSRPMLIVGAGEAGVLLSRQLRAQHGPLDLIGFVDDDSSKRGLRIAGLPVLGSRTDLVDLIDRLGVRTVAIAMPSAAGHVISGLVNIIRPTGVQLLIVPNLHVLVASGATLPLTEVSVTDLLGRGEVGANFDRIRPTFDGRRVLVTGAAGSIGSELCRQLTRLNLRELAVLDTDETGLARLRNELGPDVRVRLLLQCIAEQEALARAFRAVRPEIVLHAAAYKHVDVLEDNPEQAARTNVIGTWNCIRAAQHVHASRFVFVSSDKAVDAQGVLGASKRIGERMVRAMAGSETQFCAVRFGNVLGSRGSVIPTFEQQIASGGPITVTHPDVRRYFMSIPEAVHLILQTTSLAVAGGVYVLDMGEDVPIVTVAERLARLRGLRVPEDISIVFTGLRPGERFREALVGRGERTDTTANPRVSVLVADEVDAPGVWEEAVADLRGSFGKVDSHTFRERLLSLALAAPTVGSAL